jgi:probable rRNA maturation factor
MRRKRGGTMKTEPPSGLTSPRNSKRQAEPALAGSSKSAGGPAFRKAELARFLVRARQAAGLRGRVDLMLADDATLAQLNRDYRNKNKPTDVLSFPAMAVPGSRSQSAGDVAISIETAERQAAEQGHSLEDELKVLLLHGVLHLAGHDHETDDGAMRRLEMRLRRQLGLPRGLIERTARPASPTVRRKSA